MSVVVSSKRNVRLHLRRYDQSLEPAKTPILKLSTPFGTTCRNVLEKGVLCNHPVRMLFNNAAVFHRFLSFKLNQWDAYWRRDLTSNFKPSK